MIGCNRIGVAMACTVACVSVALATPVAAKWTGVDPLPAAVARPFSGFLSDLSFVVAGGSDFKDGKKVYSSDIYVRAGTWKKVGELPRAVAEGVSCETFMGLFCAGGTDGTSAFRDAFVLMQVGSGLEVRPLPPLSEPVTMGAAASDVYGSVAYGTKIYVVASKKVYALDLADQKGGWSIVGEIPGPARSQHVAAIQNGDQKEKMLVVYGGFDTATKRPLHDGYGLVFSSGEWKKLSPLPENTTTIGSAFLRSGHQHLLLIGGFGEKGWIDRAINGSQESDPVKLGWQRKILAYNCVTDAWCEYGEIAEWDKPRCGAAAGIVQGKTPEQYLLLVAGGEIAPKLRTTGVSGGTFSKTGKFGATAWAVVGV